MPYTFTVHHGTSWENAKNIAQNGFKPSREQGSYLGAGVYALTIPNFYFRQE